MENIIDVQDLSLTKNKNNILKNIHWQVKQGEQWAILGLNGSGKTSLLNIVNGYQFPTTGEVSVLGNRFGQTNLPELRKKIGFVSSSVERFSSMYHSDPVLKVVISGKFASFGVYEKYEVEDEEKAEKILADLRLTYIKDQRFSLLSQGEQRRVLIARALMSEPDMLILDEPCSGLDILSREQLLTALHTIVQNNCHIIYVTHHIDELVDEITHVLLMKEGKIIQAGPKEKVLTSEALSDIFTIPVNIKWENNRPIMSVLSLT